MSRLFDWESKDLTGSQRLQAAEQKRLNFKQDLANEAHDRFMQRTKNFVQNHEVGPWEKNRVMGYMTARQRDEALQEHELAMLKQQGQNQFNVAEQERLGKKEQGVDAAEAAGKWGFKTEHERGQNALTLEEKKSALQKELAAIEAATKKYQTDKGLEGEKARQQGQLKIEQERQKGALDVEATRADSAEEIAKQNREAAAAEAERARQERLQATGNKNNQAQENRITSLIKALEANPAYGKLTPAEKRAKALELLGVDGNGTSGGLSQFRK